MGEEERGECCFSIDKRRLFEERQCVIIHHVTSLTTVPIPERTEEAREEGKDAKRVIKRERGDSAEEGRETKKPKGREGKENDLNLRLGCPHYVDTKSY